MKKKSKLINYYHSNDVIQVSRNLKTSNNLSEVIVKIGETENTVVELHFINRSNDTIQDYKTSNSEVIVVVEKPDYYSDRTLYH